MATATGQKAGTASERAGGGIVRSVVRTLLWPLRRFFDPRFAGIHQSVEEIRRVVIADANAANETATYTGRTLDEIRGRLNEQDQRFDTVEARLDDLVRSVAFDPSQEHSKEQDLDSNVTSILNFEASHEGFAAQSGLWFNPPVLIGYDPGRVELRWVNERVVEVPYVFRALARLEPDARVLDVGASESLVCLSLATLGYRVTAIDPRPNPLSHERLEVVEGRIEDWKGDGGFDAVVCLSTIEHIGVEAYEQHGLTDGADSAAMARMRDLTRSGGVLVLTTSVGPAAADGSHGRVYDQAGLDRLLEGWTVEDVTLTQRRDATTWAPVEGPIESLEADAETVAMVTATKPV